MFRLPDLLAAAPTAYTPNPDSNDLTRWLTLRLHFDRELPESESCTEEVSGVAVCR